MQQCNTMENFTMFMTFFPSLVIFFFFFLFICGKHTLTASFLKEVITHATSSYLFANLFGDSLIVYVLFDLVT